MASLGWRFYVITDLLEVGFVLAPHLDPGAPRTHLCFEIHMVGRGHRWSLSEAREARASNDGLARGGNPVLIAGEVTLPSP